MDAVSEVLNFADDVSNWEIDAVGEMPGLTDDVSKWGIDTLGEMPGLADVNKWEIVAVREMSDSDEVSN